MTQNQNSNETASSQEAQIQHTPFYFLNESGKCFGKSILSFLCFCYYGVRWCFTNHPHISWGVIVAVLALTNIILNGKIRAERDSYSKENAILIDSISTLNMDKVSYVNLSNKSISVVKDSTK